MKTIAVMGIGTAGLLSLAQLLSHCSSEWQIISIHDPNTPILGIGETTNVWHYLDKKLEYNYFTKD
jgi:hypothetical protein